MDRVKGLADIKCRVWCGTECTGLSDLRTQNALLVQLGQTVQLICTGSVHVIASQLLSSKEISFRTTKLEICECSDDRDIQGESKKVATSVQLLSVPRQDAAKGSREEMIGKEQRFLAGTIQHHYVSQSQQCLPLPQSMAMKVPKLLKIPLHGNEDHFDLYVLPHHQVRVRTVYTPTVLTPAMV
ncbi:hypothetical protein EMCRGX_G007792 [Ephydatia muelleri]